MLKATANHLAKANKAQRVTGAFSAKHERLWKQLKPVDAPKVRQVLLRAQELRLAQADPGDAYIEAWLESRQ